MNTGDEDKTRDFADDELSPPSKSQRKRDAENFLRLGKKLGDLASTELAQIPLEDNVRAAVQEMQKIGSFGARKRQQHYLAKLLRKCDPEPIEAALVSVHHTSRENTKQFHTTEEWRDRLINERVGAVTEFLREFPKTDKQRLRQLLRNHDRERAKMDDDQPRGTKSSREIFKLVRTQVSE